MRPLRHELAVIVPAGQRCTAIKPLIERLERALAGVSWEAVFFAEEDDGTVEAVTRAAQGRENLRCLPGARDSGLARLCAEGLLATSSGGIAIMDTDIRQDETLLPRMSLLLREARLDAVVGTCSGVSQDEQPSRRRWRAQRRSVSAPESPPGEFFVMRREFLGQALRNLGGKSVRSFHDLLAAAPGEVRFQIMPFDPPRRRRTVQREFPRFFLGHPIDRFMPSRTARFGLIGAGGMSVHMVMLALMHGMGGLEFLSVQAGAALTAVTFTFMACNKTAPEDHRIPANALVRGAMGFVLLSAFGMVLNLYAAHLVFENGIHWAAAGMGGAAIGWVWNLTMGAAFTWRPREDTEPRSLPGPRGSDAHTGLPVGG